MPGELLRRMEISSPEEKLSSIKPQMDLYLIVSPSMVTTFLSQLLMNADSLLTMWSMSKIFYVIQEISSHGSSILITSINMELFSNKPL